jgi:ceramide glucosyltransferase
VLPIAAVVLFVGSMIYCILVVLAARSYLAQKSPQPDHPAPISVLKPLSGVDEGLEANLSSFFEQDHPNFELLFAVRDESDPAVSILRRLIEKFPHRAARLLITGDPPYPNAKVYSLERMLAEAQYEILVMSDSDIRVEPGFLASIAAELSDASVSIATELSDASVSIATCPYRAVAGASFWSQLEAEGMNTDFLAGLLVARMIEGVKFAVGPTIAARKQTLTAIGGFAKLRNYLAEDFVMGKFAAQAGMGVILSRNIVEHRIGSQDLRSSIAHRLRWARSTRRSRPLGYFGQLFTHPLLLALLVCAMQPSWWPVLIAAVAFRGLAASATCSWILRTKPRWRLLLIEDFLRFVFWLAGFFGNTIVWRGRHYVLHRDGRFEPR